MAFALPRSVPPSTRLLRDRSSHEHQKKPRAWQARSASAVAVDSSRIACHKCAQRAGAGARRPVAQEDADMPPPDAVGVYLPDGLDLSACLCPKWRDYGAWVVSGLYLRRHTEIYHGPD